MAGARVRELGGDPILHVTAPDDLPELVAALRYLVDHCDAVLVGGGLGPTPDDLTREAIADLAGVELEHRDDLEDAIRARFEQFRSRMGASNLQQARVPVGATAWPPVGTAPGFVVVDDGAVYALPGVPWEMRALFADHVEPDLLARAGGRATVTRIIHVTGQGESSVAEAARRRRGCGGCRWRRGRLPRHGLRHRGAGQTDRPPTVTRRAGVAAVGRRALQTLGPVVAGVDAGTGGAGRVGPAHLGRPRRSRSRSRPRPASLPHVWRTTRAPAGSARGGLVVYATSAKERVAGLDPALLGGPPAGLGAGDPRVGAARPGAVRR